MDDLEIILLRYSDGEPEISIFICMRTFAVLSCLVLSSPNGVVRAIRAFIILLLLQLEDNICVTGFCFAFLLFICLRCTHICRMVSFEFLLFERYFFIFFFILSICLRVQLVSSWIHAFLFALCACSEFEIRLSFPFFTSMFLSLCFRPTSG